MSQPSSSPTSSRPGAETVILDSEFACVEVTLDRSGNGSRLRVRDLRSGAETFLDALLLESLVWAGAEQLDPIVDPGWRWGSSLAIRDPAGVGVPPLSEAQP